MRDIININKSYFFRRNEIFFKKEYNIFQKFILFKIENV